MDEKIRQAVLAYLLIEGAKCQTWEVVNGVAREKICCGSMLDYNLRRNAVMRIVSEMVRSGQILRTRVRKERVDVLECNTNYFKT